MKLKHTFLKKADLNYLLIYLNLMCSYLLPSPLFFLKDSVGVPWWLSG